MEVLGIIPARGGSKGIPGKNAKELVGKPLIYYTINSAQKSILSEIIVSTDDEKIASIALKEGVKVIMRPKELALDTTPTLPVLQHILSNTNSAYDAIMTLQPTSPLRTANHINESIEIFENNQDADSLVSVVRVPHQFIPESIMIKNGKWLHNYTLKSSLVRRQQKPEYWARNGAAIYLTRIQHLNNYILGGNILFYGMSKLDSIDIDDAEDWILAELILKTRYKLLPHI